MLIISENMHGLSSRSSQTLSEVIFGLPIGKRSTTHLSDIIIADEGSFQELHLISEK